MKMNHTPLGRFRSSKKFVAGAAALALVGGIAPTLVSTTHAPTDDTIYTTVGPFYFTTSNLDLDWISDNDATVRVADTSVADFYGYEGGDVYVNSLQTVSPVTTEDLETTTLNLDNLVEETYPGISDDEYDGPISYSYCRTQYACLQGKKVGETELIISRDGEEDIRIPVKSVELAPKAMNFTASGEVLSGTGSLNGADDSLLRIRETYRSENVALTVKGERGYSISSSEDATLRSELGGEIIWTIGRQTVGGGTRFMVFPINAVDNIMGDKKNEQMLKKSTVNIFNTIYNNPEKYEFAFGLDRDIYGLAIDDGSVVNIYNSNGGKVIRSGNVETLKTAKLAEARYIGRYDERGFLTELTAGDVEISKNEETKLTNKLPKNAVVSEFTDIEAIVYRYYYIWNGSAEKRVKAMDVLQSGLGAESEEEDYLVIKDQIADFVKLGKKISFSIDAPKTDAVAAGHTRKWYATYNNNGKIEKIEVAYDKETNTLNFETNVFGTYAFGYVDEKNRDFVPAVPDTGVAPSKVITTAVATFLPLVGIAGAAFIIRSKKHAAHKLAKKHNHFE